MPHTTSEINNQTEKNEYKRQIVWKNVVLIIILYFAAIYGVFLFLAAPKLATIIWTSFLLLGSTQGIGVGVHLLWTHRAFKAKLPLRLYLAFFQTLTLQNDIYEWSRDHRVHHKFVDTNADPHNINRGFFFAHMGWLMVKKHPDVITKGKLLDFSDLEQDPVVRFQKRYYSFLGPFCCFLVPAIVPWYFWNESFAIGLFTCGVAQYVLTLHFTWLVNSYSHMFGNRPYNKNQNGTDSVLISALTLGGGYHNFHHTFPTDYKCSELGGSFGTLFIELMAAIGWAYDLKTVSQEMIDRKRKKYGDGKQLEYFEKLNNKFY